MSKVLRRPNTKGDFNDLFLGCQFSFFLKVNELSDLFFFPILNFPNSPPHGSATSQFFFFLEHQQQLVGETLVYLRYTT